MEMQLDKDNRDFGRILRNSWRSEIKKFARKGVVGAAIIAGALFATEAAHAQASNIYITQSGSETGNCTKNVKTPAFFNNSNNWGTGSTQIGPGTIALVCGTFTGTAGATMFNTNGNGNSSASIILRFDIGANLTAPYWSSAGAITINNSYIVIDGQISGNTPNGTIQNTQNGSSTLTCPNGTTCAYQQDSRFIVINGGSNIEVKNMNLTNIYLHDPSGNDTNGNGTNGIEFLGINNVTVDNNDCTNARICINGWGNNITESFNSLLDCADCIWFGPDVPTSNLSIHDNVIANGFPNPWATTSDNFHLEDLFIFPNSGTANASGVQVYNNGFRGGGNCCNSAHLEMQGNFVSPEIFNNVFDNTPNYHMPATAIGFGGFSNTNMLLVNNTIMGGNETFGGNADLFYLSSDQQDMTQENNVVTGGNSLVVVQQGSTYASGGLNYNCYENITADGPSNNTFGYNNESYTTLPQWQGATGQDANSVFDTISQINLNSNGSLGNGSPCIGIGTNLTSLEIPELDYDKPAVVGPGGTGVGNPRSTTGAWDPGAYVHVNTATVPNPPTGLAATVD